jgi:hypothetical protein
MNDALRDWVTNVRDTFYCIGTVAGPHPYPAMVRDFQSIIGKEVRWQLAEQEGEGRLPDTVVAAIGGGSNAMGLFYPFLDDPSVNIIGVEAGGKGVDDRMQHCASLTGGRPGVLHGNRTYLLQDADGQILEGLLDLGRSGLSRHRAGTFLAARPAGRNMSASPMPRRWRRSSCAAAGRHHSRAGAQPCAGACDEDRADPAARPYHRDEHVRPRATRTSSPSPSTWACRCRRGGSDAWTPRRARGAIGGGPEAGWPGPGATTAGGGRRRVGRGRMAFRCCVSLREPVPPSEIVTEPVFDYHLTGRTLDQSAT